MDIQTAKDLPTREATIKEARAWLAAGRLSTSDEPMHHGRSGRFWPIILDGRYILKLNNVTAKMDYPALVTSGDLLKSGLNLGATQRFGLLLYGWYMGARGKVEGRELRNFLQDLEVETIAPGRYVFVIDLNETSDNGNA